MRLGLILVCAAIPFLEIALMIKVGQAIGFWPTLLLILGSAALGTYVIYEQGLQVMGRALDAMQRNKPPIAPVIDGMFVLLGGLLLIVPGFLSDAAGVALLVPRVRHRVAVWSLRRLFRSAELRAFFFGEQHRGTPEPGGAGNGSRPFGAVDGKATRTPRPPPGDGPIIEGEFERLDERTVDRGAGREDRRHNGRREGL